MQNNILAAATLKSLNYQLIFRKIKCIIGEKIFNFKPV